MASELPPAAYTSWSFSGAHTSCPTASPGGNWNTGVQLFPPSVVGQIPRSPSPPAPSSRSLAVITSTVWGSVGDTATSITCQPPREPGTPNWPGAGCGDVTCPQVWPPSWDTHRLAKEPEYTTCPSCEQASASIRPVTDWSLPPIIVVLSAVGLTS